MTEKECATCKALYTPRNNQSLYCTHKCRTQAAAKKLKARRTLVKQGKLPGMCTLCTIHPAGADKKRCEGCVMYERRRDAKRRQKASALNLCSRCQKPLPNDGSKAKTCAPCLVRNRQLNRWYSSNWSPSVYSAAIALQNGMCALCRRERKLVADHCHKTGAPRSLLCGYCNVSLGWLERHRTLIEEYLNNPEVWTSNLVAAKEAA